MYAPKEERRKSLPPSGNGDGSERTPREVKLHEGDVVENVRERRRFRILKKLGEGHFASVYDCVEVKQRIQAAISGAPNSLSKIKSQIPYYALKLEKFEGQGELQKDVNLMKAMASSRVVPRLLCEGTYQGNGYFVMQKCGSNLHDFRDKHVGENKQLKQSLGKKLHQVNSRLVNAVGYCVLYALQEMHRRDYVHRDIKLANIMIDYNEEAGKASIRLIDFGLSKQYRNKDKTHIPESKPIPGKFRGTTSFASIYSHEGRTLSRRDDLWSLLYILVDLYCGTLPWRNDMIHSHHTSHNLSKDKEKVYNLKKACINDFHKYFEASRGSNRLELCPAMESLKFLEQHVKHLQYDAEPNYNALLHKFHVESDGLVHRNAAGFPEIVNLRKIPNLYMQSTHSDPKHLYQSEIDSEYRSDRGDAYRVGEGHPRVDDKHRGYMHRDDSHRHRSNRLFENTMQKVHRDQVANRLVDQKSSYFSPQAMKRQRTVGEGSTEKVEELSKYEEKLKSKNECVERKITGVSKLLTPFETYLFVSRYIKNDLAKQNGEYSKRLQLKLLKDLLDSLENGRLPIS